MLRRVSGEARGRVWCRAWGNWGLGCWGAKLGSEESPRRGRQGKGQTAWRVILQAIPVTIPAGRAMNQVLLSKGLEINDLYSSLHERAPSSWPDGWLIIMSS